jgi:ribosomal protein S18 acetylase RimI-like enzyme
MENRKVSIKIRKGTDNDLDSIFECHNRCFLQSDRWYKRIVQQNLTDSYVVEKVEANGDKNIIGVMLQNTITACEPSEIESFTPLNEEGKTFKDNNLHIEKLYGIVMICIDEKYRGKGLATKLINIHFKSNDDKPILCLNTRKSNPAYNIYLNLGYKHIANIKDKYFFPNEDSCFMVKNL